MKKTNLVLATVLASVVGFGSGAAMAESHSEGERSWKHHSGEHKGGKHRGGRHGGKHGKRGGRHGGGKHMMMRMAKKLGLTEEQKERMKALREEQKVNNQGLRKEMKDLRQKMQDLKPENTGLVNELAMEKGELTRKMFIARNNARLAFDTLLEEILTPEQKAKMAEMKAKRKARRAERMKKRMERKAARKANAS